MELATAMQEMSPAEEFAGRFEKTKGYELRPGQFDLISSPDRVRWAALVMAYGKTNAGIGCFWVGQHTGAVDRCLYIVPSQELRKQVAKSINEIKGTDICIGRAVEIDSKETRILREHMFNQATVFVTTIHAIATERPDERDSFFRDLMGKGRWMVVADEFHRYSLEEGAIWGDAIKRLPYEYMIGMSGTPERTDAGTTLFSAMPPVARVTLDEAFAQKAIRPLVAHKMHYNLDVIGTKGEVVRLTTEDLRDPVTIDERLTKEGLRFSDKYVSHMVMRAIAELQALRIRHPRYQCLVAAASCKHARFVSDLINGLDEGLEADWVGSGPFGRTDDENSDVVRRFKSGDLPILVQVNKAAEGFDVPSCAVLLILRPMNPSVQLHQLVGRVMRRFHEIKQHEADIGHVYYSADNPGGDDINAICRRMPPPGFDPDGEGDPREPGSDDPYIDDWDSLPDVTIQSVEYDRSELIQALGGQERFNETAQELTSALHPGATYFELDEEMRSAVDRIMCTSLMRTNKEAQKRASEETFRKRLDGARTVLVTAACRVLFAGNSAPKSARADIRKLYNRKAKSRYGSVSEMTESEIKDQYEWIQSVIDEINATRQVPRWLML